MNTPKPDSPLARLRHHVTGAIERGEAQVIVEQRAAPVWRLLEPGEIIREGDEFFDIADRVFCLCYRHMQTHPASPTMVYRRRMEPDPVKAELVEALEVCGSLIATLSNREDMKGWWRKNMVRITQQARAALARAQA
jgi:hypothetical protein